MVTPKYSKQTIKAEGADELQRRFVQACVSLESAATTAMAVTTVHRSCVFSSPFIPFAKQNHVYNIKHKHYSSEGGRTSGRILAKFLAIRRP